MGLPQLSPTPTIVHDMDELVDARIAADEVLHGIVGIATIRKWKQLGHLQAAGLTSSNRPMYRVIDVLRAEQINRRHGQPRRKSAR